MPATDSSRDIDTRCCIAGGGPAGLLLGYLLARSGVEVLVLEKHPDFLRDFRGDTIHPSTLTVLDDLGLLEGFLALPHQEVAELTADVYGRTVTVADFRHVPAARPFLALVPQWDFLDFIAGHARALPHFRLAMGTQVLRVREEGGKVVGVEAADAQGAFTVRSGLVVGADGRHSTVRESAGLAGDDLGAPIDVLWFRLPRDPATHPAATGGIVRPGAMMVTINRGDYWQCAFVIPKGALDMLRQEGLAAFRHRVAATASFLASEVEGLASWDEVKLLSVQVNHLRRWFAPGLLCIGDAAHAMSPIGGVGINLAIQDAVAAANLLVEPLLAGTLDDRHLAAVQRRREWPARVTQRAQVAVQDEVLSPVLARSSAPAGLPLPLRLLDRIPLLRRLPARLVGLGVRPERVRTRAASA